MYEGIAPTRAINLCSGYGQWHSHNHKTNPQPYNTITPDSILQMVKAPHSRVKAYAQWIIPSTLLTRVHKEQTASGSFHLLWADLDTLGGKTFDDIVNILKTILPDTTASIYTTKSATELNPKSRILIPILTPISGTDFIMFQSILNDRLEAQGIIPDRVNQRTGQVCYLPNKGEYYRYEIIEAQQINPANTFLNEQKAYQDEQKFFQDGLIQKNQEQKQREQRADEQVKSSVANGTDVMKAYKAEYPIETALERYGYTKHGEKWLSPNSESGNPGVKVFPNNKAFSNHDSDSEIHKSPDGAFDSFDLFQFYECANDRKTALHEAGNLFTTADGTKLEKQNRKNHEENKVIAEFQSFLNSSDEHATGWDKFIIESKANPYPDTVDKMLIMVQKKTKQSKPTLKGLLTLARQKQTAANNKQITKQLPFCFWYETEIKGIPVLKINIEELYQHLQNIGFCNTKINDQKYFIRLVNNVIEVVDITDVRNYLTNEMVHALPEKISDNFNKRDLSGLLRLQIDSIVTAGKLSTLHFKKLTLNQDTIDSTSFFFKNGFVKVTAKGSELLPYSDLDGVIWSEVILNRDIDLQSAQGSDFEEFCKNVCRSKNIIEEDRLLALKTSLGYQLNRYNNSAYQKFVIFCDAHTSSDADGGTGKSLLTKAIRHLRNSYEINARVTDIRNPFAFQGMSLHTQALSVDDIGQDFKAELLFSYITSGFEIQKKHQQSQKIDMDYNPRINGTAQHRIKGLGYSFERRISFIELLPFYGKHHQPEKDFDRFFDSWNLNQWNAFYNFMFSCAKDFHTNDNRIFNFESETMIENKLIAEVGVEFLEFAGECLPLNTELTTDALYPQFSALLPENKKITRHLFNKKLRMYCKHRDITINEKHLGPSNGRYRAYILIPKDECEDESIQESIQESKMIDIITA